MLPDKAKEQLAWFAEQTVFDLATADLTGLLAALDDLSPEAISWADKAIAEQAKLGWLYVEGDYDVRRASEIVQRASHCALVRARPDFANLFVFHRDGYVREVALSCFEGAARSAFMVMAIAYRLNDWVQPVRRAAEAAARRVFPLTSADTLATAALVLLDRVHGWSRWEAAPPILLDLIHRPILADQLATIIARRRNGAVSSALQNGLRYPALDPFLLDLATHAFLPSVRRVALRTLIAGHASWRTGRRERKWIDKSQGHFQMVEIFAQRPVSRSCSLTTLLELGLRDRSPIVCRSALDALIEHRAEVTVSVTSIERLAHHPSPSIRDRIAYLHRTAGS